MPSQFAPRLSEAPPVAAELITLDAEPGEFWFGAWQNVKLAVWHARATGDAVKRLQRTTAEALAEHPEGISTVHIVAETAGIPSAEARAAFSRILERYGQGIHCVGVVIELTGFWGSALRSAITSIRMLSPNKFVLRVHSAVEAVPAWLPAPHARATGVRMNAGQLLEVLREARDMK